MNDWHFGYKVISEQRSRVQEALKKVADQYRESPNLVGLMTNYMDQVNEVWVAIRAIPDAFDLLSAVGDQLTIIGKRMGFPRCHCVCTSAPVFGFECPGISYPLVGFCEDGSTWIDCQETGTSTICIDDDELYRAILLARRYQMLGLYDITSLQSAAAHIWGDNVGVLSLGGGRVVVSPGRALTAVEMVLRPVAFRALPIAPGIRALTHDTTGPVFGFGTGWNGFCENAEFICPTDPHTYDCA